MSSIKAQFLRTHDHSWFRHCRSMSTESLVNRFQPKCICALSFCYSLRYSCSPSILTLTCIDSCSENEELTSLCFRGSFSDGMFHVLLFLVLVLVDIAARFIMRFVTEQLARSGWLRVVCAGGDRGCPCGGKQSFVSEFRWDCCITLLLVHSLQGTHIQNSAELGKLQITKIKSRKGTTKVRFLWWL